ncbi:efflux RND transporter periplasmic adaptor subunit [Pelagicoccus albus]|uniref:Efflux RND transporter periplasmic adaptor subunit n=1 Tax=Pelagicoccus albus TaxID=415222 RepID=A0A7X1E917_9BACT|nr:efflux RND transporter periplasmic adaptor subunit [Pelagicoccus albus]MBC2605347.1 efflux RND transporter periplasmic adaptor subunit [Pelagicoccus albus]
MEENEERPPLFRWLFLHVLPAVLILLVGSALIIGIAFALKKEPGNKPTQKVLPLVEAIEADASEIEVFVESQGTVEARTQTTLFAEVSGRFLSVSPKLYAGGFFKKGEVLATIDNTDYIANLASLKSRYAEAQLAYQQEKGLAEQALEDWQALGNEEKPNDLVLRKPQIKRAEANLEAAEAAIKSAERDLSRTEVKAPYDGRVQKKFIDIGQIANARTTQIASIYATDTVEVRLGITSDDTRLIDIPETYSDGTSNNAKPKVTLTANYGGIDYHWEGIIDRSEGAIDQQTRLLYLVAQIEDPYENVADSSRPPLKIGTFVTAKIRGQKLESAYMIPRRALHEGNTLYIIGEEGKIEVRAVEPYQKTSELVVLESGLEDGELICLTPLQYVVNGMEVLLKDEDATDPEDSDLVDLQP